MNLVNEGGLQYVRGLDHPLASTGRDKNAQKRRIKGHQKRIGLMAGELRKTGREPVGDAGSDDHSKDHGVKRKLNQNAAGGGNGLHDRRHKAFGLPLEQKARRDENEIVSV